MLTERQREQRRKAGLALKASKPEGYYSELGKKISKTGKKRGRPTYEVALERAQARLLAALQVGKPGGNERRLPDAGRPGRPNKNPAVAPAGLEKTHPK